MLLSSKHALLLILIIMLLRQCDAHGPRRDWDPPPPASGVTSREINYTCSDGREYTGYLSVPTGGYSEKKSALPAVLVGHTWLGLGKMEQFRAREMAGHGYAAFALDVYGTGIRPKNDVDARATMDKVRLDTCRAAFLKLEIRESEYTKTCCDAQVTSNLYDYNLRLDCGMEELLASCGAACNVSSLFFNGYCFGGAMALHMARTLEP